MSAAFPCLGYFNIHLIHVGIYLVNRCTLKTLEKGSFDEKGKLLSFAGCVLILLIWSRITISTFCSPHKFEEKKIQFSNKFDIKWRGTQSYSTFWCARKLSHTELEQKLKPEFCSSASVLKFNFISAYAEKRMRNMSKFET